jgi:signal transduction histidine kinase
MLQGHPFFLRKSTLRAFGCAVWVCAAANRLPVLAAEYDTIAGVRALSKEEAAKQMRVHLRAVVTFFDESMFSRFVQDNTAGIYLQASTNTPKLFPGQLVEIEGVCNPGEYAPVILPDRVNVLGEAAMPSPKPVIYEDLVSGREDSQRVEMVGIVRSVRRQSPAGYFLIELASGSGKVLVYAPALPVSAEDSLPDSLVRVRGVCSTQFNHRRQIFAVRLLVSRAEDLTIESPAPAAPFDIAATPIGNLLQFSPHQPVGRRIKIGGTVTGFEAGKNVYLQDGKQGVEVQIREGPGLKPGDLVEALGFVGQSEYSPVLQDAIYRKTRSGKPLPPEPVSPDEALNGKHDSQLIEVMARLLDRGVNGAERYLVLQSSNCIFQACFGQTDKPDPFAGIANGSRVAATGVCLIEPGEWAAGEIWRAKSFRLKMRSVADVQLIEAPPWWTLQRLWWVAGLLSLAVLVTFSWVLVLRRQVELQIQRRKLSDRHREVEQERTRVAQDLHDELGATLTEVSMLGSLARTPALPALDRDRYLEQLTDASHAAVAALDEIVWAVNPQYDSVESLASYYSLFAQRFLNLAGINCRLNVSETFPDAPLDSRQRHVVFLAFKEALNNAVRHSGASQVCVAMDVVDACLKISVSDNGRGFDPARVVPGSEGLESIYGRLSKLGGSCRIDSRVGTGTTIEIQLPLRTH